MSAEDRGVKRVLRSAALTYLTGLGRQLSNFLFFVAVAAPPGARVLLGGVDGQSMACRAVSDLNHRPTSSIINYLIKGETWRNVVLMR